ncbi:MAG: tetratricopeptide repeat protein [Planctomycetota bacterium]|jgi:tetratricopeptide (TPR) repeat protein
MVTVKKLRVPFIYAVLALATLIAFEPMRHNDFVGYDDPFYVTRNPNVNAGITLESINWAFSTPHGAIWNPVTTLSHMLDCQLFGLNPFWHHLSSLLSHIASTLLVFGILKRTTGSLWRSAFVAAAFALHPLRVESVAWVASRKDVLSVLFWMLTVWAYIRYTERPCTKWYLATFLFLLLGLMSKPMLLTLPFAFLLLDYWPLGRFQPGQIPLPQFGPVGKVPIRKTALQLVTEKLPLFALVSVAAVVAYMVPRTAGALELTQQLPLSSRLSNALVAYIAYIGKIFYPGNLAVLYPHPRDSLPAWQPIAALLTLILISAAVFYKGSRRRYLAMGWLWYLGTLIPVIGLVQLGHQAIADRYTYLPSIGIFIIAAWGAAEFFRSWRYRKAVLSAAATIILVALLMCTRAQLSHWRDSLTLYKRALAVTKNNYIMHYNFANALLRTSQYDQALSNFKRALAINPRYFDARSGIGKVLLKQGKFDEAVACFEQMLQQKPNHPDAHYNLGLALAEQGEYAGALEHFHKALRVKPNWAEVYYDMGRAAYLQDKRELALKYCAKAVRVKCDFRTARINLAETFAKMDKFRLAVEHFNKALEYEPADIHSLRTLAWLLAVIEDDDIHDPGAAVKLAQRACELTNYEQAEMLDTLAIAYAAAGRFAQAVQTAKQALELAVAGEEDLALKIHQRLQLYQAGQPYRQPSLPREITESFDEFATPSTEH